MATASERIREARESRVSTCFHLDSRWIGPRYTDGARTTCGLCLPRDDNGRVLIGWIKVDQQGLHASITHDKDGCSFCRAAKS